jgi:hypothetical protein
MNIDALIDFCTKFKYIVEHTPSLGRINILTLKDILYWCLHMNGCNHSYSMSTLHLYMDVVADVKDSSFGRKRDTIGYAPFKQICQGLLDYIYKNNNTPRIIAVDGTYIPLSIKLKNMDSLLQ